MSIAFRQLLLRITLIGFVAVFCDSTFVSAQVASTIELTNEALSPEHPITRDQMQALLAGMKAIEGQKVHLREALAAQQKTLPAWFPPAVWDEIAQKIEAIDLVDVDLPIYRKYVSHEQADAIILLFQGPTGEEIGQRMAGRALTALRGGARGAAADAQAIQASNASDDNVLFAKRFAELTPEQRDKVGSSMQAVWPAWRRIDNEQDIAFNQRAQEIFVTVQKAHQPEMVAAKRAASQAASSQTAAPHQ